MKKALILLILGLTTSAHANNSDIDRIIKQLEESETQADVYAEPEEVICDPKIQTPADSVEPTAKQMINIGEKFLRGGTCKHYKKFLNAGVPKEALKQALTYYDKNNKKFKNQNYITIADYSQSSTKKRFFLLDMRTGKVSTEKVSHGSGSAKVNGQRIKFADATINKGQVTRASNHNGRMVRCRIPSKFRKSVQHDQYALTRPGFFKTGEFYMSWSHDEQKKGRKGWPTFRVDGRSFNGMRMDGLSKGVNDKARAQGVVMHEAYYNTGKVMGRSFGCPAFPPNKGRDIMEKIAGGSLYYSFVPISGCSEDYNKALKDIPNWERACE